MLQSSEHTYTITTKTKNLRKRKRKGRKIKTQPHPENAGEFITFDTVKLSGNCCWTAWNRKPGEGQSMALSGIGTQQLKWLIRYVELNEKCN